MYNLKIFVLIILFIAASACSSTYYKIRTLEPDFEIEDNKEIIYISDSLYDISINFHNLEDNYLDFFVYINNKSEKTISINPSDISIEYLNRYELFNSDIFTNKSYALNPEKEIEVVDGNIKSASKEKNLLSCLNCLGASLSIIGIVTSKASDGHKVAESVGTAIEYIGNQSHIENTTESKINYLQDRKFFWENSVLKFTNLSKNEDIGGRILIPFNEKHPYFRLIIPIAQQKYSFKYHINKFRK